MCKWSKRLASLILPMMLMACSGNDVSNTLGLNKKAPDEFRVLARPPLTMPPEYNLRPPGEGASQVDAPAKKASVLLLGPQDVQDVRATNAAQAMLDKAGADEAQEGIKQTLNDEYEAAPVKAKGFWQKLKKGELIKEGGSDIDEDEVLNPKEEFDRLRKERAQ